MADPPTTADHGSGVNLGALTMKPRHPDPLRLRWMARRSVYVALPFLAACAKIIALDDVPPADDTRGDAAQLYIDASAPEGSPEGATRNEGGLDADREDGGRPGSLD